MTFLTYYASISYHACHDNAARRSIKLLDNAGAAKTSGSSQIKDNGDSLAIAGPGWAEGEYDELASLEGGGVNPCAERKREKAINQATAKDCISLEKNNNINEIRKK